MILHGSGSNDARRICRGAVSGRRLACLRPLARVLYAGVLNACSRLSQRTIMPRLAALGGLAVLGDNGPLVGAGVRGRNLALLVLLVRAGEAGLTREKLAAYLWPESDAERSRHSLEIGRAHV